MRANTEHDDEKHSRKGVPKAQVRRAAIAACMATVLVLLCAVAGPAFADEDGQLPNGPDLASGAEEVADAGGLVNSEAAEELPHRNLDRKGASELVEGVFGPVLESAGGLFDDLRIDHFLADNVAVVDPTQAPDVAVDAPSEEKELDSAGPRLLDSTLPLRTENDEGQVREVDLDLEHREGEIQPANPLVDVGIPNELGEGIELPEMGITIGVDGAPGQVSPSIVGESVALYPNISEDTDFAVAPTPTGIETLTTIRSSQSPTEERYTFKLPEGAELHLLKNDGGAEITQGGESLVQVPPPSALDANGASVETTLGESSGSLTVSVEPGNDAAYPILVDPLFQTYEWKAKNSTTGINNTAEEEQWRWAEGLKIPMNSPGYTEWYLHKEVPGANYPIQAGWRGLYVHGLGELRAGDHFGYMYSVPRYYSDQKTYGTMPESYISRMELSNVVWIAGSPGMSPYVTMGLYDPNSGYVSFYKHEGLTGHSVTDMAFTYPFENKADTGVRTAFVGFDSYENLQNARNALYVGSASLQLAEPAGNIPGLTTKGVVPWSNGTTLTPVEFTASDSGLGVYSVTATDEKDEAHTWKATYGCTGTPGSACPRTWKATDVGHPGPSYDPSVLPEGEDFLKVTAQDPLGNVSAVAYVLVKIDRTLPSLALTGTITEQASLGTSRPSYELEINSKDGSVAIPQSGVAKTAIEVDGKVVNESAPGCTTQNCSVSRKWTLEASQYASGQHVLKVVATDAVGNTVTRTQSFSLQPAAPPAVELAGTATQQASLGTSRPRYILKTNASTSAGFNGTPVAPATFATSFGGTGEGKGQFNVASGSAVDSKGNLWVVDWEDGRVEQFNTKGEYLGQFGEPGLNPGQLRLPLGLAIDAAGNFWVTCGDGRIEEFSSAGKFIKQFGKSGKEDGAFSNPADIAIDSKGNLWISDTGNFRVQEFNQEGKFLGKFGVQGKGAGQISGASGIAIAPDGSIWLVESSTNRVQKFNQEGKFLASYGEEGAGNGSLSRPDGIRIDQAGNVYVADGSNGRIEMFNSAGEYLTQFGTTGTGPGQIEFPSYLSVDSSGNIWVDSGSNKVQRWHSQVAPPTFSLGFGSKGSGPGQLTTASSVATDSTGNLWVVDRPNARIEKFNTKGEYLSQFGVKGNGAGQLLNPYGVAIDPSGNIWVTDTGNTRVAEFNGKGEFIATFGTNVNKTKVETGGTQAEKNLCTAMSKNVCQAGTPGSLEGQMKEPTGIAVSSGGNLFVVEKTNGRVEKFSPTGAILANFGSYGAKEGQLQSPTSVAVAPDGSLWVADTGNRRLEEWTSTFSFVRAVGKEGTGNGQFTEPWGLTVDSSGNVWVADMSQNRIQGFSSSGDFLTKFGTGGSGEGQLSSPYALAAGSAGSLWIADTGHGQIQKWIPPTSKASTITSEVTIDGTPVSTKVGRCGTEACTVASEWTLEAGSYAAGKHTIQVKATDGLGRSTSKTLSIELQKDVTKPTLETTGALATAPEGWVEQQTYNLNATATDAGYGVTSLVAKIDGKEVASSASACLEGGCKATISKVIDMSAYAGGSHSAEVIATDGAGNVTTKAWTINVDPEGHISVEEAADTLEAIEETTEANPIGPPKEEDQYYGSAPGLGLVQTGSKIVATGSEVPATMSSEPAAGVELEILPNNSFAGPCETESSSPEEEAALGEDEPESEMSETKATACEKEDESAFELEDISVSPTETAPTANENKVIESHAVVASNTATNVDSIVRPLYEGVLTFQDIRDSAASETFTWEVELTGGQELKLLDSQHAAVYYAGGHPAFGIQAQAAHDAIGTSVPTKLEVSGNNLLTLRVEHHAGAFVYPVLSGVGWQGGFVSTAIQGPKDEQELKEERERIEREEREAREQEEEGEQSTVVASESGANLVVTVAAIGPPIASVSSAEDPTQGKNSVYNMAHKYKFVECRYDVLSDPPEGGGVDIPEERREATRKCKKEIEAASHPKLVAALVVHGWFHDNQVTNWVWIRKGNLHCNKRGPEQPAMVNCEKRPAGPSHSEIHLLGDYRFPPGEGNFFATELSSACDTIRGRLEVGPEYHQEESIVTAARAAYGNEPQEPCDWP
jgi:sugar lactone lactonase YvrE